MTTPRFQVSPPLSTAVRLRRALTTRALAALDTKGYAEIEVPLLAPYEDLRTALGPEISAQLFRFVDRDGTLLVLRGDLTPLVARQLAQVRSQKQGPIRVSYATRVARVQSAFAREQVESNELGFECVGVQGLDADVEVMVGALSLLEELGVQDAELSLGDVRISGGLIDAAVAAGAERAALEVAIAHRDPVALTRALGDAPKGLARAIAPTCELAPTAQALECIEAAGSQRAREGAAALRARVRALQDVGRGEQVVLDLSAQNDRGYYTGMRFVMHHPSFDSRLGSGGRYDELLSHFGQPCPAVGFGLSVDPLVFAAAGQGVTS